MEWNGDRSDAWNGDRSDAWNGDRWVHTDLRNSVDVWLAILPPFLRLIVQQELLQNGGRHLPVHVPRTTKHSEQRYGEIAHTYTYTYRMSDSKYNMYGLIRSCKTDYGSRNAINYPVDIRTTLLHDIQTLEL